MGCLFGKQEQAQNRYQMKGYDRFQVLQLIQSYEEMYMIFNLQGAWNHWVFQYCDGKLLQFLIKQRSTNLGRIVSYGQGKFLTSSIYSQNQLSNIPKSLFHQIISSDDEFLKKNLLNKDEIANEQYSCFDESDIELEQEPEVDLANQSIDLSGIENKNVSPIKNANFDEKTNHQQLITDYLDHFLPDSKEVYCKWLQRSGLIKYFQQSLYLDLWFDETKLEDHFLWQKSENNVFVKRRFQLIDNKLLILYASNVQDILGMQNYQKEIIPLWFTILQDLQKEQHVNKFGLNCKCEKMKLNTNLYFDTQEELHLVHQKYAQRYQILKEEKQFIQCVNKSLGLKLTIQKLPLDSLTVSSLIMHESISNFKGVVKCHEAQHEGKFIYLTTDNIAMTLEDFIQSNSHLNEFQIRSIAKQLIVTFDYLHMLGIVLVSITPKQIGVILNKSELNSIDRVVILNFINASYSFKITPRQTITEFAAPEVIKGELFNESVDSYLLYLLLVYIIKGQKLTSSFSDFLSQLQKRIPLKKALNHQLFKDETITKMAIEGMVILQ